jgi:hypothetical protein
MSPRLEKRHFDARPGSGRSPYTRVPLDYPQCGGKRGQVPFSDTLSLSPELRSLCAGWRGVIRRS